MGAMRIEHDALGPVEVPAERLWGAQTQRALRNFPIGTERMPRPLVQALVRVKRACARSHAELGTLPAPLAEAIVTAADEVLAGRHDAEFPLGVWQTGSGTQTNMNVNEVLANRASELLGGGRGDGRRVHPNDHVNLGQSSNDVFPTALHLAAAEALAREVRPAVIALRTTLAEKSAAWADVIKLGRTHLQDATPLTLGQACSGWVAQLDRALRALDDALPHLCELALGGTAVGTGVNAPPELAPRAIALLSAELGLPFVPAPNRFEALAAHDGVVLAHAALKTLAGALFKLANDIRWLGSGPRAGIGELRLPANEPGSSIMPGKVNPTQAEALTMVCVQVMGNDVAASLAGASGAFELNTYKPLLGHLVLQSARLLADATRSFEERCARGLEPDRARIAALLERSLMLVTALAPRIGYDRAAAIAKAAHEQGLTLREAALASGQVSAAQFDAWVRPEAMLGPAGSASAGPR